MQFFLFLLLLLGQGYLSLSAAGNISVTVKEKQIVKDTLSSTLQKFQNIDLAKQQDIENIKELEAEIAKFKNVNIYKPLGLVGKSNLYWVAGSIAFSIAVDSLIQKIEEEKEKQKAKILPAGSCVRAVDFGDHSAQADSLVSEFASLPEKPGEFCFKYAFQGYSCYSVCRGGPTVCTALYKLIDYRCPASGFLIRYDNQPSGTGTLVDDASPLQNKCPPDFEYCKEPAMSEIKNRPSPPAPFVLPPDLLDQAIQSIPESTTYTIPLPDSVKTPSDIQSVQPLSSPDGGIKIDIPYAPGDGSLSPLPSPSNPVLDFADDKGNIQVIYNINNNTYNEYNTTNTTNTANKEDYTFNSPSTDFDTKIDVPKKQDIASLVQEMQSYLKNFISRFFTNVELNSSQCSFSVPNPFGGSAVLDFCQYQNVVNLIGQIVLSFSYLYAIYIIFRVE